MNIPLEITPAEVKRRLDDGDPIVILDVREPVEYQQARIDGSELIPMGSVPGSLQALETKADDSTIIVVCHHGVRSLNVVAWLRKQGLEACQSMQGGIDRWSLEIDPTVPRYF